MPLHNSQYETIMRRYSRIQSRNERIRQERREEIRRKIPEIASIEAQTASRGAALIRRLLSDEAPAEDPGDGFAALEQKKRQLLLSAGYPEDYLELPCTCPVCKDTGFVNGEKCVCFRQAEIELLYQQSSLREILKTENFSTFSLAYYPDEGRDPSTGLTPRETAREALNAARQFAEGFDREAQNLFLYGETGVGKTFLSHCIAAELLGTSPSVLYFPAYDLFRLLAEKTFEGREDGITEELIFDCDLLIIDDVGTEITNAFVASQLFLCVSERILRKHSTILSTNLTLQQFKDVYSERTFSRIAGNYRFLKLTGKDIRIQKKYGGK